MTIKATSLLSLVAIWAAMIPAVIVNHDAWWTLIFAFLASGAVGIGMWRRLGIARLIALIAVWAGTAFAVGANGNSEWMAIFAFLATGAVVYSAMRRTAWLLGIGIAVAWGVTGAAAVRSDGDATWICIFAFLTAATVANSWRGQSRGIAAAGWWGIAGTIMLAADDYYWLAVLAWLFSTAAIGIGHGGFTLPRRFEWDLFERDDEGPAVL